jgi:hypothetical protein
MAMDQHETEMARGGKMNKDILKGLTIFTLMVALAILTSVVSANAQSQNTVVANIPFEFVVGSQTLPAGEYIVRQVTSDGSALVIQGSANGESAVRLTETINGIKKRTQARLVFHRYGDNYFLAQVWTGYTTGRALAKSKHRRAIERELASIPSKSAPAQSPYETIELVAVLH